MEHRSFLEGNKIKPLMGKVHQHLLSLTAKKNLIFYLKEGVEPLPEILEGSAAAETPSAVENAEGNPDLCFYQ